MADFAATVDAWALKSRNRLEAIFRQATQKTVSLAQSRCPVDSGFARASIRASTDSMPQIESGSHGAPGQTYGWDGGDITATIASAPLGSNLYFGYTANYAIPLERGHSQQAPSGFVRVSVMEWPRIVSEVVADAKSRAA